MDPAAMKNAPIVETMFIQVQPGKSGYVKVRRGMPANPSTCWIMKVRLNPIVISQNVHFPIRSDIIRPLIFGNQ
jgi:hypothetical protein